MANYVDAVTIYGLMNKDCILNNDTCKLSYYKSKKKQKAIFFERLPNDEEAKYSEISYKYLQDKPVGLKCKKLYNVTSIMRPELFTQIRGKRYQELRSMINKFRNIEVSHDVFKHKDALIRMINEWRDSDKGGKKYYFNEHSGIDRAFVSRYLANEDNLQTKVTYSIFLIGDDVVGYSVITNKPHSKEGEYDEYVIPLRKALTCHRGDSLNGLTLYIDWYTFKLVHERINKAFLINWGAGLKSSGVFWYKTHKWDVHTINECYFAHVKNAISKQLSLF